MKGFGDWRQNFTNRKECCQAPIVDHRTEFLNHQKFFPWYSPVNPLSYLFCFWYALCLILVIEIVLRTFSLKFHWKFCPKTSFCEIDAINSCWCAHKLGESEIEVRRLHWPADFSGNEEQVWGYVTSLVDKYQIQVHLLYVIEDGVHHQDRHGEFGLTHIDKSQEWE